jgi:TonB family protein
MRTFLARIAVLAVFLLAAAGAQAAVQEDITLQNGKPITVTHPGVDGVTEPIAYQGQMVAPEFPNTAKGMVKESTVTLAVLINRKGRVAELFPLEVEHPDRGFDDEAMRAVAQWRFKPARDGKEKVNSYAFVTLTFKEPISRPGEMTAASRTLSDRITPGSTILANGTIANVGSTPTTSYRGRPYSVGIPRPGYGDLYRRSQPGKILTPD